MPHFSKQQIQILNQCLENEKYPEALNYTECHGFLCGLASGPSKLPENQLIQIILTGNNAEALELPNQTCIDLIKTLFEEIEYSLFNGETLLLPCSLTLENSEIHPSLADWAYGFFEAYLLDEDAWYAKDSEIAAEMLLPILMCVEELEDEELAQLKNQTNLAQKVIQQIPLALQDIYLFFNCEK